MKKVGFESACNHWAGMAAFCHEGSHILAISVPVGQFAGFLAAAGCTVEAYFIGKRTDPPEIDMARPHAVTIVEKEEWRAGDEGRAGRYDCALADFSFVNAELGRVIEGIKAVLKPGGVFACLVPFGWKRGGDYPYFLSRATVVRLLRARGFSVLSEAVLPDTVHGGYASLVTCRADGEGAVQSIDESVFLLKRFEFVPHDHESFEYHGPWSIGGNGERIAKGSSATFTWQGMGEEVLIVCERHAWSGIGEFHVRGTRTIVSLFSWFAHTQPERVFRSRVGPLEVKASGRSLGSDRDSLGSELVVHGLLWR